MRRAGGIAAVALLLLAAFALGLGLTRAPESTSTVFFSERADRDTPGRLIDEVRQQLAVGYYRSIDREVMAQPTVERLLAALNDPHTDYLTPKEYQALRDRISRSYSGVGLQVGPAKGGLRVESAFVGPAREAGIRRGDIIVSVNGRSTRKLPFRRSLELIRGEKRTILRLIVRRPQVGTMRFTVVRDDIALPALRSRLVTAGRTKIGYVRLLSFRESAADRVSDRAEALVKRGAKGLVLDLRGNDGGLLSEAIDVASVFMEDGVVCTTAGEHQKPRVYHVVGEATHPKLPLVVLVDHDSASAAEILAAALAENGRAVLVGERTYGKASVQSVRVLSNGGALKFTTATYRTPSGFDIEARGVRPKVKARDNPKTRADEALAAAESALLAAVA
jgi:carboxyl-terminal processing protease